MSFDDPLLIIRRSHAEELIAGAVGAANRDIECRLRTLEQTTHDILRRVKIMAEQSQAALAELKKDLLRLADGWAALKAENDALKAALAEADAVKAQAVADAIAADDAVDSAAIADADEIVEGLSPEPTPEPEPAPEG